MGGCPLPGPDSRFFRALVTLSIFLCAAIPAACKSTDDGSPGQSGDAAPAADGTGTLPDGGSRSEAAPPDVAVSGGGDGRADGSVAGARPLEQLQKDFLDLKYGMFLHFNMSTFMNTEYATPNDDPRRFNPVGLDTNQWAATAVAAGIKYAVLTAKHHDGFCLWDSALTKYDVGSSSWKGGKGDVVKEYADAMKARGLAVGIYFSIADRTNGDPATGLPTMALVKGQLRELLTNYGPILELWFDGWPRAWGENQIRYDEVYAYVKSLQPGVLVAINSHAPVPTPAPIAFLAQSDIVEYEKNRTGTVASGNVLPSEVADNIRADGGWFFFDGACQLKTLDTLSASFASVVQNRGNWLLDLTPDVRGLIPDCQVQLLTQLKPHLGGL